MFGLFISKEQKETEDLIGMALHSQIKNALSHDQDLASDKLNSAFLIGYLNTFIKGKYNSYGFDGNKLIDKRLKELCERVYPKTLFTIYKNQYKMVTLAKSLGQDEVVENLGLGMMAGEHDAQVFNGVPESLELYLNGNSERLLRKLNLDQNLESEPNADFTKTEEISSEGYELGKSIDGYYRVVRWYFDIGDYVEEGESLVEVEGAEQISIIPAWSSGVLTKIYYAAKEDFEENADIGQIGLDLN